MEELGEVKALTLGLIKELNETQLVTIAESLSLTVKEEKKSKLEAMRNLIHRHLTSEDIEDSPDEGLDLYKKVAEEVSAILDAQYQDKSELEKLKDQIAGGSRMSKLELKLKDEMDGGLGGSGTDFGGDELLDQLLKLKLDALGSARGKRISKRKVDTEEFLEKVFPKLDSLRKMENDAEDVEAEEVGSRRLETSRGGEKKELTRMKLKDFKIDGGVVGGEKNSLDYCSLRFQMDEGLHQGYTKKEVRTGVIKAIKAGTTTRRYFERNAHTITHEEFLKTLRELYDNSDTDDLVDEMCERVQGKGETEREYFMAMFELRDNINEVTKTDDEPLGPKFVQKRMLRAISVGLRKDTVRLEMKDALKDVAQTDSQLLEEVNAVVARDTENRKKMGKGNVNVNALSGFNSEDDGQRRGRSGVQDQGSKERARSSSTSLTKRRDQVPSGRERSVSFKKEDDGNKNEPTIASVVAMVSVLQSDLQEYAKTVADLQKQVAELVKGVNNNSNNRQAPLKSKFLRCKNCEASNSFCTHCTVCNESGHKRFNCPKNP